MILDYAAAQHQLTETLTDLNKYGDARAAVTAAQKQMAILMQRDAKDVDAGCEMRIDRFQAGRVEEMAGNADRAAALYEAAYRLRPPGDRPEAAPSLRLSIEDAEILLRWAACLRVSAVGMARHKLSQVLPAFAAASETGSSSPDLPLLSGEALALGTALGVTPPVSTKDLQHAAQVLDKLLLQTPRRVTALRVAVILRQELARVLQASGNAGAATAELARANEFMQVLRQTGLFTRADSNRQKEIAAVLSTVRQ